MNIKHVSYNKEMGGGGIPNKFCSEVRVLYKEIKSATQKYSCFYWFNKNKQEFIQLFESMIKERADSWHLSGHYNMGTTANKVRNYFQQNV